MKAIGFACDSTADFRPGLVDQLGLHILPVHIVVDGRDHRICTRPFLPGGCAPLYDRLLETHRHIVSFHLSTHYEVRKLKGRHHPMLSGKAAPGPIPQDQADPNGKDRQTLYPASFSISGR